MQTQEPKGVASIQKERSVSKGRSNHTLLPQPYTKVDVHDVWTMTSLEIASFATSANARLFDTEGLTGIVLITWTAGALQFHPHRFSVHQADQHQDFSRSC
jgi:hypothetical protein